MNRYGRRNQYSSLYIDEDERLKGYNSVTNNAPTTQDDRATRSLSYASGKNSIRQNRERANEIGGSQSLQIEPKTVEGGQGGNKSRYSSGANQNPPPKTEPPVNKNPPPDKDEKKKKGDKNGNKSPTAAGKLQVAQQVLNTLDMLTKEGELQMASNDLSIGSNWTPNMYIDEV